MNLVRNISSIRKRICQSLKSNFSTFQLFNFLTRAGVAILATAAAISASAATEKELFDKEVLTIDSNTTWSTSRKGRRLR